MSPSAISERSWRKIPGPTPAPRPGREALAQYVLLGQHGEAGGLEPAFERQHGRSEPVRRQAVQVRNALHRGGRDALLAQQPGQPVAGPFAVGGEQHPPAGSRMGRQPVGDSAVEVDVGARPRLGETDCRPAPASGPSDTAAGSSTADGRSWRHASQPALSR